MTRNHPTLLEVAVIATAFKLLLLPAYKSTDFEVHRNWLAITHSLPVKEWYYEKTSEWTLDYPPFFAAFEWAMSQVAVYFDKDMLRVANLGYDSFNTVLFQRLSVILTELVLVYALNKYVQTSPTTQRKPAYAAALAILLSPGFLIIDHIHFQYNGFMYGLLLLSIVYMRDPSTYLRGGILFAVLLCFKHIYLYLAPAYFVFLLRAYCLGPNFQIQFGNAIKLGTSIITVFGIAFGPFAYWGQIPQVLSRLFPFSRGLTHAYWAPNVWAIYSFLDRFLIMVAPKLGLHVDASAVNSVTRGLVGDSAFAVLPNVTPRVTFVLTLAFQMMFLIKPFLYPTFDNFLASLTLCGYGSFLFGWHVHEKAILLVLIPFSLLALKDRRYLAAFRPLAVAGHVSLFPLLFTAAEFPIKTVYTIFYLLTFLTAFELLTPPSSTPRTFVFDRFAQMYWLISVPLIAYTSLFHGIIWGKRFEFLPLMFTSAYAALGVVGSAVGLGYVEGLGLKKQVEEEREKVE
ncbi:ALG6, ALG8 glycosyltransferase [Ascobolus immersus RN42]|uniref:Alpha-1,3-glucosyltransferase n=1 Tax=Ascobolus immersus RN42 TaxID=1160509 RepID=A0A3N4J1V1_ASCIM|nr:ALG6, ALG8 glycosyltransferase [Ascobolus immersus RN42]